MDNLSLGTTSDILKQHAQTSEADYELMIKGEHGMSIADKTILWGVEGSPLERKRMCVCAYVRACNIVRRTDIGEFSIYLTIRG